MHHDHFIMCLLGLIGLLPVHNKMCCAFRDALTAVVTCGYFNYCCLPVCLNQSCNPPLTSVIRHYS